MPAITCCSVSAAFRRASVDSIWAGNAALVAIGFEAQGASGPGYRYLAWQSLDGGRSWHRSGHELHGPLMALPSGRGFVGLGQAVWTSADGGSWRYAGDIGLPGSVELGFISDAVPTAHAWLGVGTIYKHDRLDSYRSAGVWTSHDGRTWQAIRPPDAPYESHFDAIAAGGPGFVVVGYGGGGDSGIDGIWTSTGGGSWRRVLDSDVRGSFTFDVAADADGRLVVVGAADGGLRPAAWSSDDGIDWQRAPDGPAIAETGSVGEMRDVVALPDGGFAASGSLDGLPALWASADGTAWQRVPLGPAAERALSSVGSSAFSSIVVSDGALVLAGNDLGRRRAVFLTAELTPVVPPSDGSSQPSALSAAPSPSGGVGR